MRAHRIHLAGGPGSGKTTAAKILADTLGLAHLDLDSIFWEPYAPGAERLKDADQRDAALARFSQGDSWVVEGAYAQPWLMPSLNSANLVIALEPSVWVRDFRIVTRWLKRRLGTLREDPPGNSSLRWLLFMLRFSHRWSRETRVRFEQLARGAGKPVIVVKDQYELLDAIAGHHPAVSDGALRTAGLRLP